MAKSAVTVKGLNQVQRWLLNLTPALKTEIKQKTEYHGRLIEYEAKANAPVDTGKGRQSITYEPTQGGLGAVISVNEEYMWYHEFGTGGKVEIPEGFEAFAAELRGDGKREVNLPARPFLTPAFIKHRELYYQDLAASLSKLLRFR